MYRKVIEPYVHDFPDYVECAIKGQFPKWLQGSLLRNGSGKYSFGDSQYKHLFDGAAVLHQYKFDNGEVRYRNKLLETEALKRNTATNRIVVSELGTVGFPDPCKNIFARYFSYFFKLEKSDNACINIIKMGDQLYAMTEIPLLKRVNTDTLETVGQTDLGEILSVHLATAHPLQDPDGTVYNLGTGSGTYVVIKVPPPQKEDTDPLSKAEILFKMPAPMKTKPSYYHSFAMTENHIVFIEQPLYIHLLKMLAHKIAKKNILGSFMFDKDRMTKFHIIDKTTGQQLPVKYESDAMFFFHTVNAYEENGCIVLDISAYDTDQSFKNAMLDNIRKGENDEPGYIPTQCGDIRRFILPIEYEPDTDVNQVRIENTSATGKLVGKDHFLISPEKYNCSFELCRINEKFLGKKYRYAYGIETVHNAEKTWLVKLDMLEKTSKKWKDPRFIPCEPVFVPDPEGQEEDDGVILSPLHSIDDSVLSALLVLDAKTFTEIARAEAPDDVRIPFSFHGIFTSDL